MRQNHIILIAALLCALCTCSPTPDTPMGVGVSTVTGSRISITRAGVIKDDLAYGERRGLYIIKDNQTGVEYIGVSGIGISEIGSHLGGKVISRDER